LEEQQLVGDLAGQEPDNLSWECPGIELFQDSVGACFGNLATFFSVVAFCRRLPGRRQSP
jgi:hypothetical protein